MERFDTVANAAAHTAHLFAQPPDHARSMSFKITKCLARLHWRGSAREKRRGVYLSQIHCMFLTIHWRSRAYSGCFQSKNKYFDCTLYVSKHTLLEKNEKKREVVFARHLKNYRWLFPAHCTENITKEGFSDFHNIFSYKQPSLTWSESIQLARKLPGYDGCKSGAFILSALSSVVVKIGVSFEVR